MPDSDRFPAFRLLQQRRIPHRVFAFDAAIRDAGEVATATGVPADRVYKTLVIETDPPGPRPYIVMAPSDSEVDLKALAATLGHKRLRMASHRDAERLTGLQVGGIGALALTARRFPTLIDERALAHETILVSAGARGFDIELAAKDLVAVTAARPVHTS